MSKTIDDLFDDDDGRVIITEKDIRRGIEAHNRPRDSHVCELSCKTLPGVHDMQDIFDDFQLSTRKRDVQEMEIRSAVGREHKEKMLLRRFQSTLDGSYVLRMETVGQLTKERMGDLRFETQEDLDAYYDYCIDVFGFSKALKLKSEPIDESLFDDLFDEGLDDLFDVEDDDDDLFGPDEDDEYEGLFD